MIYCYPEIIISSRYSHNGMRLPYLATRAFSKNILGDGPSPKPPPQKHEQESVGSSVSMGVYTIHVCRIQMCTNTDIKKLLCLKAWGRRPQARRSKQRNLAGDGPVQLSCYQIVGSVFRDKADLGL